jgi:hypothetical protein
MEGISVIRTTFGTYDTVYTVTTLFSQHGRCQCYKEDYWDVRRCIQSNYMYIVLSSWKVSVF